MVLAKIPGGPPGVKGISLFIIPRYRVDADGNAGESNDVSLAGLNHKMGQCITPNCALNFGENGGCTGYLVGEPHRGLEYMFLMMNEARIGVGLAAVGNGLCGLPLFAGGMPVNAPRDGCRTTRTRRIKWCPSSGMPT